MYFRLCNFIILCIIYSHTALATEPFYDGENGIRAQVFATKCLACHSSELSGSQRDGAPTGVNFDTFSLAVENGNRAIVRAVNQMNMPPSFSGIPPLNQEQKEAMQTWQQAGFPRIQTNTTFDFNNQMLTMPVIKVGESIFSATLELVSVPGSSQGFGFALKTVELSESTSTAAATFFPETGTLEIPEIDLLNSNEGANKVRAQMKLMSNTTPVIFELTDIEFLN